MDNKCERCNGTGKIKFPVRIGMITTLMTKQCRRCKGIGKEADKR